jgi:hypothetical protein
MYKEHIQRAFDDACSDVSNIDRDILKLSGMTGRRTRHFYNNICSLDDIKYLEIGSYSGSSLCSALSNNNIDAHIIDNWSLWAATEARDLFLKRYPLYQGNSSVTIHEACCWEIAKSWKDTGKYNNKFNVYLFDGPHRYKDQYNALAEYIHVLSDNFIFLVDDWNWIRVRNGTLDAIRDLNLEILHTSHHRTGTRRCQRNNRQPYHHGQSSRWHNGIGVFELKKT